MELRLNNYYSSNVFLIKKLMTLSCSPIKRCLKFGSEVNWANNILGLRQAYNFPLNDANIKHTDHRYWKSLVKSIINQVAFSKLVETCSTCRKTSHLTYPSLKTSKYLHELDPQHARVIFRSEVRILDLTQKALRGVFSTSPPPPPVRFFADNF